MTDFLIGAFTGFGIGYAMSTFVGDMLSDRRVAEREQFRKDAELLTWQNGIERRLDSIEGKLRRLATWEDDLHNPFFVRKDEKSK